MERFWLWFWILHWILAAGAIVTILRRRGEPVAMLAWIWAILLLPLLGFFLYALLGSNRVRRKASRRRRRVAHLLALISEQAATRAGQAPDGRTGLPADLRPIEQIGRRVGDMPAVGGNEVRVFHDSETTYAAIAYAIQAATRHVHMLYYIWKPDETGLHFRDLLIRRAREGVECRVLLDSVGCLRLPREFTRPMIDAGVRLSYFLPLYPLPKRISLHLRNHRKIVVVDGETAFLGSQNIGDEYRGRLRRLSPWYDSHMRIRGPAALFVQQIFAEDWLFATGEPLRNEGYFVEARPAGESVVQVVPSGPEHDVSALGQLLFAAVAAARESIRIATPYFVPDEGMRTALLHAAYRGVKIMLVLPTRSDNPLVLYAGRSFYPELLDAGVEIYEFDAGMLHSKIVTIDDRCGILGSANMDVRSFRFNFEVTALVYDTGVTRELSAEIDRHIARSKRVLQRDVWRRPLSTQLLEGAARLFSPLL